MSSSDPDLPASSTDVASPQTLGDKPTSEWADISTYDAPRPAPAEPGASTDPLAVTDPVASPTSIIPDARYIQHYELIRELGRGGMGIVHLARDLRLGRLVAIKMLTRPGSHQERFLAEARATARCRHENIVVIHDVGLHGEQPYLVFEYLRGQTLRQWMEARTGGAHDLQDSSGSFGQTPTPLTPTRAVEIILPVVRALVCAHDMGIIHRDLKPANILLTEDGLTKVLDFGVAKIGTIREDFVVEDAAGSNEPLALTALGARLGTLPYMSPEQLASEVVDHRSDIWAVGIILYELVTGAHPLAPLSPVKIHLMADVATPMPSVREHRSDLGPLADIISRCLLKDREHRTATARELLQELEGLLPTQRTHARNEDSNPFAGLAAFQESDAGRFFGRDHEIASLVGKLRTLPLVAVAGPSGAGKSSVVRAGVIPALKRSGEGWEALIMRPGRQPLAALADTLLAVSVRSSEMPTGRGITRGPDLVPKERDAIITRLCTEPGYLGITLRTWARAKLRRILLFIDQFEELWTLDIRSDERANFLACLSAVADDSTSPLRLIVSMRSDFLDRLAADRYLSTEITRGMVLLSPMSREGLRESLLRPVEVCDFRFESTTLVDRMVEAFNSTPGALPLLQFTASRLWELRDTERRLMTEASYEQLGGVDGALASHAEDALARMPAAHRAIVREIFRQLSTADGTRAILTRRELRQMLPSSEADDVIEELIRARLLMASEDDTSEARVEVVHEALLSSWPRLVGWLREDAESARLRDQLRAAARQWVERGRSRGLLWRGDALLEYQVWRARYQGALTDVEHEFARTSLHEQARGRRLRNLTVGTVFAILCAGLLIVLQQRDHADAAARQATRERDRAEALARESQQRLVALYLEQGRQKLAEGDALRAFPYLAEARKSGEDDTAVRFLLAQATRALEGQELVLAGHQGPIWDAAMSPDGALIATGSSDRTARIWDARTGALVHTLVGFSGDVWRVRFAPNGAHLLTAGREGDVFLWSVATGARLWSAPHGRRVRDAAFSHDGTRVATGGDRQTIELRDAADGRLLQTFVGHTDAVNALAFSLDDAYLLTGSDDEQMRVWSVATGALVATIAGHGGDVYAIAVSPDGMRGASASWGGRARVFPLRGGPALDLAGHDDNIHHIAFAPDGSRLITSSEDRTAKVWDAATGALVFTLSGHQSGVRQALFTPDGQSIITVGLDGAARRWSARTGRLEWTFLGHRDGIWSAHIDPAGDRLLTASADGTARVWRARQQRYVRGLHVPGNVIVHASFAPDGARIATIDRKGIVQIWDDRNTVIATMTADALNSGLPLRVWWSPDGQRLLSSGGARAIVWDARTGERLLAIEHGTWIPRATWSHDGTRIVTTGKDGSVRLWDAGTGTELLTLTGHELPVTAAEFDPSGRRVASASLDQTVRLWDATTGALLHTLSGHTMQVLSARFSVDGTRLITASADSTARISTATGEPLQLLEGHATAVWDAVLGPDGRIAVTASMDGTARVWNARTGTLLWSIGFGNTPVTSVELDRDGRLLLLAAGDTAEVIDIAQDDRSAAALAAFSACRVGYVFERGQLQRVQPDTIICKQY